MGKDEGRQAGCLSSLEASVRTIEEEYYQTVDFGTVLEHCTSLSSIGCVVGWCLLNFDRCTLLQTNSSFVWALLDSGVWHKARRRNLAFPIREGDFVTFREVVRKLTVRFGAVMEIFGLCGLQFSAWGWRPPCAWPMPGKWHAAEKMLAKAVELSVVRFESLGDAENPDLAEVEKELRSKRVNYSEKKWGLHTSYFEASCPSSSPKRSWWSHRHFAFGFTGNKAVVVAS